MDGTPSPSFGTGPAKGALLRNVVTILLIVVVPLIGTVAIWTIAPWNRRAKILITAVVVPFALYQLWGAFMRGSVL